MKSIEYYIKTANKYILDNHKTPKTITLNDVKNRLNKSNFLGVESTKTKKGEKDGFLTAILYLAPYKIVGFNLCPMAKTCIKDCLFFSGRGKFDNVSYARILKTLCFLYDKTKFKMQIEKDIIRYQKRANKLNYSFSVRINGTSDINVNHYFKDTLKKFNDVFFYDYTKIYSYIKNNKNSNYSFTFSYDGTNLKHCLQSLKLGTNVSIVFKNKLPKTYLGFEVIDGDKNDLRFLDKKGVFIGLIYKNVSNKDINKTFVVDA